MTGDVAKLAMAGPLVEWPPPKNENESLFVHFTFEGPLSGHGWALLSLGWTA